MKKDWSHLEGNRIRKNGNWSSSTGDDFGTFSFLLDSGVTLAVIACAGDPETPGEGDWEHVSVHAYQPKLDGSQEPRTPTWEEMCHVKRLFWEPSECVVEYHPPDANYVNVHSHTLHLWRPIKVEMPQPPVTCV